MRSLSAVYWAQAERTHCKGVQLRMQRRLWITFICLTFEPSQPHSLVSETSLLRERTVDRQFIHTAVCVQRSLRYLAMWEWLRSCHSPQEITTVLYFTVNDNSPSLWRPCHPEAILFREPRSQKAPSHHVMAEVWCLPGDLALNLLQWEELGTASPLGPFWDASWTEKLFYMKAPFIAYYETHCLLAKVWPGQLSSNACWW